MTNKNTASAKLTMIQNHWLSKTHHDSQKLDQHSSPLFNHFLSIAQHDAHPLAQHSTP
jgi:hypothetical protein